MTELHSDDRELALLPLKNVVILPKSIIPVIVGRESSMQAVEHALRGDKTIFVTAQKDPETKQPTINDVYTVGTKSVILQVMRMQNNSVKLLVEGLSRARVVSSDASEPFIKVMVEDLPTTNVVDSKEIQALWRQIQKLYAEYVQLNEKAPHDLLMNPRTIEDIEFSIDTIAVHINLNFDERQQILEENDFHERMLLVAKFLQKEIDIIKTEQRIRGHIQTQFEKNQREYYLNEQLKAINKELGRDDQQTEINDIRAKLKQLGLSAEAQEKVERELRKLEQSSPYSSEASVSRNYIEWLTNIPWKKLSKDSIGLTQAQAILDKSHAGLKKVKERIIEFLAAQKFSGASEKSPVICLVGPPGVGKTSLTQAIADSLGRELVRISLGGVRDEAEIRGHRRTYIGAMPGKIIQGMRKAKTINPVMLLDEIDKISHDLHGDPAAALLEVLDPEQNKRFNDHYLDVDYDLSKVLFITTANTVDSIPYALFDRMEIIALSGYTEQEKLHIAHNFLLPRRLKEYGLKARQCKISDEVLALLIDQYSREAGVRQLDRLIAKLMRKTIQELLSDPAIKSVKVTPELVKLWLGYPKFKKSSRDTNEAIGLATGLAWTEVGGDVLDVESTVLQGKSGLTLTGQMGEVMQESAQAALSYIKSRAQQLGISMQQLNNKEIHIHIPEGATPKDGPSAGITMGVSIISALTKIPTKPHVAMTGEITLRGRVLGVGGLKEKILAAQRYDIKTIILPQENYDDVQEFLPEIDCTAQLIFVKSLDEVLPLALAKNPLDHKNHTKKSKPRTAKKKNSRSKTTKK